MACTYLLQAGLEGVLTSRSDFTCKITFIRAGLESLVLRVEPRGEEGLGFRLTEGNSYPYLPWQPLTQSNLNVVSDRRLAARPVGAHNRHLTFLARRIKRIAFTFTTERSNLTFSRVL